MSHLISIEFYFSLLSPFYHDPLENSPFEKTYAWENIQETDILSLKTHRPHILNLDEFETREFSSNPIKIFREIFEILPQNGSFSFGNTLWRGLNPEKHQMELSKIFEEQTTKRLKIMAPFQFRKYIDEMLTTPISFFSNDDFKKSRSNLFKKLKWNDDVFQKVFLAKDGFDLRMCFFKNIDHQKFAYQEIMQGNLNPFFQWNKPSDYQGIDTFPHLPPFMKLTRSNLKIFLAL